LKLEKKKARKQIECEGEKANELESEEGRK
jgi:hypothetical protein